MISQKTIEEIKDRTDMVQLVEQYGVSLRRAGANYVGLCPVHSERSPSFNVNPNSNTFRCFGCGISGDVISFLQEVDAQTFSGAVELLGDMLGIEVIDSAGSDPDYARKKRYIQCVSSASWYYRSQFSHLPESHPAKQNLAKRNYLTVEGRENWLEEFGMGYAPIGYTNLVDFLTKQGFTHEEMIDAGLAKISDKSNKIMDRFRNRLLWEIRNIKGQVVGFSGRRLNEDDNPKYLNTASTIMYNKSKTLVGLDLARKEMDRTKTCYVAEGAADVMAVSATGYTNVVGSCGTSFGSEHASIIRRIIDKHDGVEKGKFVFVFDGDEAGLKASMKMFTGITPSIKDRSYVVNLDSLDPSDFRVQFGDEALRERLENPISLTEFVLQQTARKYDMSQVEGRSNFSQEAMQIISYIEQPEIYEEYKRKISFMSGTNMAHLRGRHARVGTADREEIQNQPPTEEITEHIPVSPIDAVGKNLVACLIQFPNETFFNLMDKPKIQGYFTDDRLKLTLREAMQKIGHTALANQETRVLPKDFTNQEYVLDFYYVDLGTSQDRASLYSRMLVKKIEEMHKKEEARIARNKIVLSESSAEDALKELLAKRKKA